MKTVYHDIVFMQDDDAKKPLKILRKKGAEAAVEYLAQWDYGDESEHSPKDEPGHGSSDHTEAFDDYLLSYNLDLRYIGLTRCVRVDESR